MFDIPTPKAHSPAEHEVSVAQVIPPDVRKAILDAVAGVRFGAVEIVIHDARVVQIETREKIRVGDAARRA